MTQTVRLLSIDAACAELSLGRSAVYERIADGSLRSIKVGRRRLISTEAIQDFIRSLEHPVADEDHTSAALGTDEFENPSSDPANPKGAA